MTEATTAEIFRHLVDLAALELDESEAEYLRPQLNSQLKAIRELEAITLDDAAGSPATASPIRRRSAPCRAMTHPRPAIWPTPS